MPSPSPSPAVRVVSKRTVKPATPRPRERIPLTPWDAALLSVNYIQKGLLFAHPPFTTGRELVDHLAAALADTLAVYYPVAGRFVTEKHRRRRDGNGGDAVVVGCSVFVDCGGQGAEILHAVADGVGVADVAPPDADVPTSIVQSLFPLNDAVCCDGHELPLFAVQVTELSRDGGVFLEFACNHALADGTAFWDLVNAWADIARARLAPPMTSSRPPPVLERWSPDGSGTASAAAVLPCADPSELVERAPPPAMRERMLHFSEASLAELKERARLDLLAAGDAAGAAALTRFQALTSLIWRAITRARRLSPDQATTCRVAINNRSRLRPPLPPEYFGNSIYAISTPLVRAADLLRSGHGRAAAAVGRAVAAHTDAEIRARVAAWAASPVVYMARMLDTAGVHVGSSPRFDMYGCDFGWGKAVAARSGRANKWDGKVSLYPGRDGGIDVEVALLPDHMAALEEDVELRAAVSPDAELTSNE